MPSSRSPFTARLSAEHEAALNQILSRRGISRREWITEKIVQDSGVRSRTVMVERTVIEELLDAIRELQETGSRYIVPETKQNGRKRKTTGEVNAFILNMMD